MSGSRSRRKGHNWERTVAKDLSLATGAEFKRVLTETREGNQGDVRCSDGVPLVIQCKVGKKPRILQALKEAKEATDREYAIAAIHVNSSGGSAPSQKVAVMDWDDFLQWVSMIWNNT